MSLEGYNRLRFPLERLEVICVDDGSTDDTAKVCEAFDPRIEVKYVKRRKDPTVWNDCAFSINDGIRIARGEVIICTHPEILPGPDCVSFCCDTATSGDKVWASCKGYYLSPRDQERIDTVPWREQGPVAFRQIDGFYDHRDGHPDYLPKAIESVGHPGGHPSWDSWIWGGCTRRQWSHLGGFIRTTAWGSCDLLMLQRRNRLGIRNVTGTDDGTFVAHFNHDAKVGDFVPTDRDMQKCFSQAGQLTREQCHWPAVDELWGPLP